MQVDAPPVAPTPFAQPTQESQRGTRSRARTWIRFLSWYWGSSLIGLPILRVIHFAVCLGCIAAVIVFWALGYVETQIAALFIAIELLVTYAIASAITQVYYSQYPGRYDLRLSEYIARRVSRLRRKDFIPRSESYGETPEVRTLLNEVRSNLRLELQRARREREIGAPALTAHGILVTGPKHSAKKSVLWDAMKSELPGWTFVTWPHHMDHPANLPQRFGYRIVLWVEHLSDYASPGEAAALMEFIQRALQLEKRVIVLTSCRDGKSLQVAQRYFTPLISQLRHIKASETFTPLVPTDTYPVSNSGQPSADRAVQNQLAVLKALRWLKDAGALTFPYPVVQLLAPFFGFESASGSDWDETIAALSQPDREFVRTAERADATARLESTPRSFFERHILRTRRNRPSTVTVLVPMNVFNLALLDSTFQQASKSLERNASFVIERLKEMGSIAIETLILLGDSFLSSQRGDERASSAQAAKCYTAARELLSQQDRRTSFHTAWAATLLGQGNAALHQAQLRQGKDPKEYLTQANEAFQTLLASITTLAELPALSAQAHHGLGDVENAYAITDSANAEQHLQNAATQYSLALAGLSSLDLFWNETQLDLANALQAIATDEASTPTVKLTRMKYIQDAREAYAKALLVYSRETSPAVWAEIQRCLADMHLLEAEEKAQSAQGDTQEHVQNELLNAVGHIQGHYYAALTVFSPFYLPVNWAEVQLGLANVFVLKARVEKSSSSNMASIDAADTSLDRASEALAASEETLSLLDMPLYWVETRLLRGHIALEKYQLKPVENEGEKQVLIQAIETCKKVLDDVRRVIRRPYDVTAMRSAVPFAPTPQQEGRLKKIEEGLTKLEEKLAKL
jgi:hypothetical protein